MQKLLVYKDLARIGDLFLAPPVFANQLIYNDLHITGYTQRGAEWHGRDGFLVFWGNLRTFIFAIAAVGGWSVR